MLIDLGFARVLLTLTGPSEPWWLTFAIGTPLGLLLVPVVYWLLGW